MNKKFFTLMAAALIGGAAMPSEAFAQATPSSAVHEAGKADSTLLGTSRELANGLKFMLRGHENPAVGQGNFFAVEDSSGYKILKDSTTLAEKAAIFEVRDYDKDNGTFKLYVDGVQYVQGVKDASGANVVYKTFIANKQDCSFDMIKAAIVGQTAIIGAFKDVYTEGTNEPYAKPAVRRLVYTASNLNANLNGSFKLGFPDAKTEPEKNPFGDEAMIAMPWENVAGYVIDKYGKSEYAQDSVVFVLNDQAGKAFKDTQNNANFSAATFVVVDPTANYGITGFSKADGEGFGFTTVKGSKLAEANSLDKDGNLDNVNIWNAAYSVGEFDACNAAEHFGIKAKVTVYNGKTPVADKEVEIGAYALTESGSAYYVTTVKKDKSIVLSQFGGNSYVDTKGLLKTNGPAIYNILNQGTQPTSGSNAYGKYVVLNQSGKVVTSAPAKTDLANADAQWIVTEVGAAGKVVFTNARDLKTEKEYSLYKTDGDLYEVNGGTNGAEKIKLIPVTENDTYRTFTKDELKQTVQLTFKGEENLNVKNIYIYHNEKSGDDSKFVATTDGSKSAKFGLKEAGKVQYTYTYAYLKDGKSADGKASVEVPTYYLMYADKGLTFKGAYDDYRLDTAYVKVGNTTADEDNHKFVFKKNYNGNINIQLFKATISDATAGAIFRDSLMNVAKAEYLSINTTGAVADSAVVAGDNAKYINVALSFNNMLGETLPQEVGRVEFQSEDGLGGIAMRENAKGMVDAIIADEPATFWLDTADTKADFPTFYIRSSVSAEDLRADEEAAPVKRFMLYTPSALANYWDADQAKWVTNKDYMAYDELKAIFVPAAVVDVDKVVADISGKETTLKGANTNVFKFHITEADDEGGYYISNNEGNFLRNANGVLVFTANSGNALVVSVNEGDPTANEAIAAEGVQVIGGQGAVTVQGAAGKVITVANILGQTIANQVAASDNVTIAVPAGIVVVAVEGEATKVVVK